MVFLGSVHAEERWPTKTGTRCHKIIINKIYTHAVNVIKIAVSVFLFGASLKNIAPNIAESIGANAIITKVLATLVFCIDIIKVILQAEKLNT